MPEQFYSPAELVRLNLGFLVESKELICVLWEFKDWQQTDPPANSAVRSEVSLIQKESYE
jgi:hypothetical protein